jgi:hypothetical protein
MRTTTETFTAPDIDADIIKAMFILNPEKHDPPMRGDMLQNRVELITNLARKAFPRVEGQVNVSFSSGLGEYGAKRATITFTRGDVEESFSLRPPVGDEPGYCDGHTRSVTK